MSDSDKKKPNRRDFILTATTAAGAVGVGAAVWPLVDQMNPDASVKALASTEVDISSVQPGQSITVIWRGKPVFIKRRTQDEIDSARAVDLSELKHPEKDEDRARARSSYRSCVLGYIWLVKCYFWPRIICFVCHSCYGKNIFFFI